MPLVKSQEKKAFLPSNFFSIPISYVLLDEADNVTTAMFTRQKKELRKAMKESEVKQCR